MCISSAIAHTALIQIYLFPPRSGGGLLPELQPPVQVALRVPDGGQHAAPRAVTQLPAIQMQIRAANDPSVLTITEQAPTRAFSWLKAPIPYDLCVGVPISHLLTMG